jgi:hypothetical protein
LLRLASHKKVSKNSPESRDEEGKRCDPSQIGIEKREARERSENSSRRIGSHKNVKVTPNEENANCGIYVARLGRTFAYQLSIDGRKKGFFVWQNIVSAKNLDYTCKD